jgi:nucleoside-diphosphate-sugar epimerase
MKILITGTNRGLGKFLHKEFPDADTLTRNNNVSEFLDNKYDLIIHCAASVTHLTWQDEIPYSFYYDNIFLTKKLVEISHNKFVYISSIDQQKTSPYGISKKISEAIVKENANNYQIIRPTGLIGKEMKKNTFQKILHDEPIALTADSVMNYVLYDDVLDVINNKDNGVITLSANGSVTMKEVADIFGNDIKFGDIYFDINSDSIDSIMKKSSIDNINEYIDKYEK